MKNNKKKTGIEMIKPVEIVDEADQISTQSFIDEFGDTAMEAAISHMPSKSSEGSDLQTIIDNAKDLIKKREMESLSRLDVLKEQTDSLGSCVTIASEIYMNSPIPDHAYQLSALTSAFNASLSQVEKLNDPVMTYNQISEVMEAMFREFVSRMAGGIDRIRVDIGKQNPQMIGVINAHFERMLKDVSPDTAESYEKMQDEVKKILGIKKGKPNTKN